MSFLFFLIKEKKACKDYSFKCETLLKLVIDKKKQVRHWVKPLSTRKDKSLNEGTKDLGGYSKEDPPLTIPNREVKLLSADGTTKVGE